MKIFCFHHRFLLLILFFVFFGYYSYSQTNTFPATGNVGVGTINPQDLLHISKDSRTGSIRIGGLNGLNNGRIYIQADLINDNSYIDVFGDNVYKKLFIDASSLILNSNSGGNIGIGTSSPTEKLSVKGRIRAQEIKVETANWPDYVFAKDYQLPSLKETEEHINEKGHLPGIPSAKEVETNGIDLGEMNAKLLQKIEELTLHLIEQQKKNDLQTQTMQQMETRILNLEKKK